EQHQWLVKLVLIRIASPTRAIFGIGSQHMVEGHKVAIAQALNGPSILADCRRVCTDLSLGKGHAYLHRGISFFTFLCSYYSSYVVPREGSYMIHLTYVISR